MADGSKLANLRRGIPPHKKVTLGYGENTVDVMVVLLSSDISQEIDELTEEYCKANESKASVKVRNQYYNRLLCLHCMRDPEDPHFDTPMAQTVEEVGEMLDLEDIKIVCQAYQELIVNRAPKLEVLKEDELEEIKNFLEVTPLKDLSTVSLVHLKYFHQTIVSEK